MTLPRPLAMLPPAHVGIDPGDRRAPLLPWRIARRRARLADNAHRRGIGAGLPGPPDPADRRLHGRRHHRFRRAATGRSAQGVARTERHRREPAGRQRRDRGRVRGQVGARRLHALLHDGRSGRDQSRAAQQSALRSAARFRAGRHGGVQFDHAGGERRHAGQLGARARRARARNGPAPSPSASPVSAPSRISGSSSTRRRPASNSRRCRIAAHRRR